MKLKAYHISHKKNRESILIEGLIPMEKTEGRIQYGPSVFFSLDELDLGFDYVNFENVDCWEFYVDKKDIKKDNFSGSTNHFSVSHLVPPGKIKLKFSC